MAPAWTRQTITERDRQGRIAYLGSLALLERMGIGMSPRFDTERERRAFFWAALELDLACVYPDGKVRLTVSGWDYPGTPNDPEYEYRNGDLGPLWLLTADETRATVLKRSGRTVADIADETGSSPGQVRGFLACARMKLYSSPTYDPATFWRPPSQEPRQGAR